MASYCCLSSALLPTSAKPMLASHPSFKTSLPSVTSSLWKLPHLRTLGATLPPRRSDVALYSKLAFVEEDCSECSVEDGNDKGQDEINLEWMKTKDYFRSSSDDENEEDDIDLEWMKRQDCLGSRSDDEEEDGAYSSPLDLLSVFSAYMQHRRESLSQVSEASGLPTETTRRRILGAPMFLSLLCAFGELGKENVAKAFNPAVIDITKSPTKAFDPTDERLRDAAYIFEKALKASTVDEEEQLWTLVLDKYSMLKAEWVPDIISRAYGNRGNARSRQGKMEQALEDYNKSILLAPYAVDPVLNRGVVLESLGRFEEARADYESVLQAQPDDPAAWNNLGNVKAAQNKWEDALLDYRKAVQLAPSFAFAAANYALALYQVGRKNEALKQFRSLLRKYPEFPDVRAALAVSLYAEGLTAEAENNWQQLEDARYKDRKWVRGTRRWPGKLADALEAFLDIKSAQVSS